MSSKSNNPFAWIRSHKLVVFLLLVVVAVAAIGIASVVRAPGKNNGGVPANNTTATKQGKVACLPHKNNGGGPQTTECSMGLQAEDGKYYGLKDDASAPDQSPISGVFNKRVEITGMFDQANDTVYDIVGTLTISKLKVLE